MTAKEAYEELIAAVKEIATLSSCAGVLGWDHQVNLPPEGAGFRARQTSLLAGMAHDKFVAPRIGELLTTVEASDLVKDSESMEAANIREIRREYDKETKLPKKLVE
jgi:carboxypeptidase Taq